MPDPIEREAAPTPFWMPDTQGFLAIAIISLIGIIIIILLVHPPAVDERTAGALMMLIGVLTGCLKDVYGFFFNSSQGSKTANALLAKSSEKTAESLATATAALAVSAPVASPPLSVSLTGGDPPTATASTGTPVIPPEPIPPLATPSTPQEPTMRPPIIMLALALAAALTACNGVTLTKAAATACRGQEAANIAGEAALALGHPEAAAAASLTSKALGLACKW